MVSDRLRNQGFLILSSASRSRSRHVVGTTLEDRVPWSTAGDNSTASSAAGMSLLPTGLQGQRRGRHDDPLVRMPDQPQQRRRQITSDLPVPVPSLNQQMVIKSKHFAIASAISTWPGRSVPPIASTAAAAHRGAPLPRCWGP